MIHDYVDARECFETVEIKGGIMYFRWDREYSGDCIITSHRNNKIISSKKRPLILSGMNTFIRQNEVVSIIQKVIAINSKSFDSIVSSRDPFGLDVRAEGTFKQVKPKFELEKTSQNDVAYYYFGWRKNGVGYIPKSIINEGHQWIDKPKVFVPCAWGNGRMEEDRINPFIPEKCSVCFETYLMVGPFDNWDIPTNVVKYMNTKFFHVLVSPLKISQHATQSVYKLVPLQDFTEGSDIDWSRSVPEIDAQLYAKYGLSDEEIAFIESMIKPM